jgi:hypothetical protein
MSKSALAKKVVSNVVQLISENGTSSHAVSIGSGIPAQTFSRRISGAGNTPLNLDEVQAIAAHFDMTVTVTFVPNEVTS